MGYTANSTSLGNNYLRGDGLRRAQIRHYQAHHMIPLELVRQHDAENQYYYDQDWNCLFLPDSDDAVIHSGSHPDYTSYVGRLIDYYIQNHTNTRYTYYGASLGIAKAIRAWYNDVIPILRRHQVSEVSINFINNIEEFVGKSVLDYIT